MPKGIPAVSVIIAACNAEAYLRVAVESIISQSFTDWELIVVNDGSTDATANMLAEYAKQDARVEVINQDNAGLAAARNAAIGRSRGEFVAIMDSDDISHPRRLEMQRNFLLDNPECAAVSCRCELINECGELMKTQRPREPLQTPGVPLAELLREPTRVNQTAMLRIASFENGSTYRPWFRILEDFDFSLRVAERHNTGYINDPPLYQYRQYPAQSANLMNNNPVMSWYYWCAAVLSAHCRRNGETDPLEGVDGDTPPQSFLPALAALPHPVKAACIKNARHWCRRLLRQGVCDDAEQIIGDLAALCAGREDARVARNALLGVLFYALRAGQWKLAPRILRAL